MHLNAEVFTVVNVVTGTLPKRRCQIDIYCMHLLISQRLEFRFVGVHISMSRSSVRDPKRGLLHVFKAYTTQPSKIAEAFFAIPL